MARPFARLPHRRFSSSSVLYLLLLAFSLTGCARAQVLPRPPSAAVSELMAPPLQQIPVEERLEYQISWWGIPVCRATLESTLLSEEKLLKLTLRARSNWTLEPLYPVRVRMTSLVDPETASPRRFEAYVKRRWRVHESVVTFDPIQGTAFHKLPKGRTATVPFDSDTQDGLSLVYYARTLPFQLGKTIPMEVTADGRNWDLKGRIVRASVIRIGRLGRWPAVEGQVTLAYPVPFFHGARARVWFSADDQRIPLLAKIHSRIGPVTAVLTRRENGV